MNWNATIATVEKLLNNQEGLNVSFTFGTKQFTGVRTNLRREDYNSDEGLIAGNYVFSLLCPLSQFNGSVPEPRVSKVTIGAEQYRVLSTDTDAVGATVRLNLGSLIS